MGLLAVVWFWLYDELVMLLAVVRFRLNEVGRLLVVVRVSSKRVMSSNGLELSNLVRLWLLLPPLP